MPLRKKHNDGETIDRYHDASEPKFYSDAGAFRVSFSEQMAPNRNYSFNNR